MARHGSTGAGSAIAPTGSQHQAGAAGRQSGPTTGSTCSSFFYCNESDEAKMVRLQRNVDAMPAGEAKDRGQAILDEHWVVAAKLLGVWDKDPARVHAQAQVHSAEASLTEPGRSQLQEDCDPWLGGTHAALGHATGQSGQQPGGWEQLHVP